MSKLTDFLGGIGGGGGIGGMPIQIVSSDTLLSPNFSYGIDTSQGVVEVTLPASPIPGDRISFFDAALTWNKNPARIHVNGNQVEQETVELTSYLIGKKAGVQELLFMSPERGWKDMSFYLTGTDPVWSGAKLGTYPLLLHTTNITTSLVVSGRNSQDFEIPTDGIYVLAATGGTSSAFSSSGKGGDTVISVSGDPYLTVEGSPANNSSARPGAYRMAKSSRDFIDTLHAPFGDSFFVGTIIKAGTGLKTMSAAEVLGISVFGESGGLLLSGDVLYYGIGQTSSSIVANLNGGDTLSISVGAGGGSGTGKGKSGEFRIYKVEGLSHDL